MKKQLLLLSSLAALLFSTACQREVENGPVAESKAADLYLTVQSVAPMSRAVAAQGDESTINHGTGFVFRGTGNDAVLDCAPFSLNTEGNTTALRITTDAKSVFLVTNTKNIDFSGVRTLGDLKGLTSDLFDGEIATQNSSNLVMWGQASVVVGEPYTATVTLRFAPAKLNFTYSIAEGQAAQLLNPEVVVLNAQGTSRLFPTASTFEESKAEGYVSLMPGMAKYYAAIDMIGFGVNNAQVKEALKVPNAQAGNANTFYLFENTSDQSTIVAVRGTYEGKTYYYPIHFSSNDQGSTQFESILAGKLYNVSAKINHLAGGSQDPTNPVSQVAMEVTVVPAQWYTSVSWEKEFN